MSLLVPPKLTRKQLDWQAYERKFGKKPKTTDETYTPQALYDELFHFVDKHIHPLKGLKIERPFVPGGDFEAALKNYGPKTLVFDNPPFSQFAYILKTYHQHGVKFFLFANWASMVNEALQGISTIYSKYPIEYKIAGTDKKAVVKTCFVHNLHPRNPTFGYYQALDKILQKYSPPQKQYNQYIHPPEILTLKNASHWVANNSKAQDFISLKNLQKVRLRDAETGKVVNLYGSSALLHNKKIGESMERQKGKKITCEIVAQNLKGTGELSGLVGDIAVGVAALAQAGVAIANAVQENKRANARLKIEQEQHGKNMVLMDQAITGGELNLEQKRRDIEWIQQQRKMQLEEYERQLKQAEADQQKRAVASQWLPKIAEFKTHENVLNSVASGFGSLSMLLERLGKDDLISPIMKKQIDFVLSISQKVKDKAQNAAIPADLLSVLTSLAVVDFTNSGKKKQTLQQLEYVKDGTYSLSFALSRIHGAGTEQKYQRAAQFGLFSINNDSNFWEVKYSPQSGITPVTINYQTVASEVTYDMVKAARKKLVREYKFLEHSISHIESNVETFRRQRDQYKTTWENEERLANEKQRVYDAVEHVRTRYWEDTCHKWAGDPCDITGKSDGKINFDGYVNKFNTERGRVKRKWDREMNALWDKRIGELKRLTPDKYNDYRKAVHGDGVWNYKLDNANRDKFKQEAETHRNNANSARSDYYRKQSELNDWQREKDAYYNNLRLITNYAKLHKKFFGDCHFFPIFQNTQQFVQDLRDPDLAKITLFEQESGSKFRRLFLALERICRPMYEQIINKLNSYKDYSGGLNNAPSIFRNASEIKLTLRSLLLSDSNKPATHENLQTFLNTLDDAVRKSKIDLALSQAQIPTIVGRLIEKQQGHIAGLLMEYLSNTILIHKPVAIYANVKDEQAIQGGVKTLVDASWQRIKTAFADEFPSLTMEENQDQELPARWVERYYKVLEQLKLANPLGLFDVGGTNYVEGFAQFLDQQQARFVSFAEIEPHIQEQGVKLVKGVSAEYMHLVLPNLARLQLKTRITVEDYQRIIAIVKPEASEEQQKLLAELPAVTQGGQAAEGTIKAGLNWKTLAWVGGGVALLALLGRKKDQEKRGA